MGNNGKGNKRKQYNKQITMKKTVDLDKTDFLDVVFDDQRLEDEESLDLSFVDDKKNKELDIEVLEFNEDFKPRRNRKKYAFSISVFVVVSFVLCLAVYVLFNYESILGSKLNTIVETKIVVDDNYVFLGDSIYDAYDLEKYFEGLPAVNSGVAGHMTTDVLEDMNDRVYRYNPSKVFIMIGTNDVYEEFTNEETAENIGKIIDGIKANRPYAEIYVQSICPINGTDDKKIDHEMVTTRNNEDIQEKNRLIKAVCEEKEVTFIDVYDLLVDEEGNLNLSFTTDGVHITSAGYEIMTKEIMKYIEEK